ncbi:hypothetical protein [Neisseria chenwenguii]|uniref:Uncharacterized protein n=1 Tax=Neisseria chenwenguii TaxID=1853278 RepID=A0A220S4G1_9NEIS|nr:hypothetical protein [Neisseria chenwenguii]ASK28327.1 hypothetical protein BG910_11800 [Neisseria chenwenguii]ROV55448.1 hypothetical protein EGS38_09610 [Neisseria chenwenguii]
MKLKTNFALICAAFATVPAVALAAPADTVRDAAAMSPTGDYVNSGAGTPASVVSNDNINDGAFIRKDEDKISLFNDIVTINPELRLRVDSKDINANNSSTNPTPTDTHSEFNASLWFRAKLYKDWKAVLQIEPNWDLETGKMRGDHDIPMVKLYGEGTVYNFSDNASLKARVGKFGAFSSYGRIWDTEVTGGELFFDNKVLPTKIVAGRRTGNLNDNAWGIGGRRKQFATIQSTLPINENINVGATVSYMKDVDIGANQDAKNAVFGEIGTDVKFNDDWRWMAAVSKSNIKAYNDAGRKIKNDGVFTQVRYKLADWKVRNSYDIFLNYRRVGPLSGVSSVEDYSKNVQGVQIGANFVPWKDWKFNAFYLRGKQVTATVGTEKQDVNVIRGQLEYKF